MFFFRKRKKWPPNLKRGKNLGYSFLFDTANNNDKDGLNFVINECTTSYSKVILNEQYLSSYLIVLLSHAKNFSTQIELSNRIIYQCSMFCSLTDYLG